MLQWYVVMVMGMLVAGEDLDLSDLSLLPLNKLIAVKRSLASSDDNLPEDNFNETVFNSEEALPLRGDPSVLRPPFVDDKPNRRHGSSPGWLDEVDIWKGGSHHHHHFPSHGGKGKLNAIFQGTVTALAFLAFGGYLLCLILHALKEKKAALTMSLATAAPPARVRREAADPSEMYTALRQLAEGYRRYNDHCLRED